MLRRNLRLRQKSSIRQVFAEGKSFSGRYAVIYIQSGGSKFCFIASKKIGNAVVRNRAKRLMREAIRLNLSKINSHVQMICIARASIKGVSYSEVEKSIMQTLKKAKVLNQ